MLSSVCLENAYNHSNASTIIIIIINWTSRNKINIQRRNKKHCNNKHAFKELIAALRFFEMFNKITEHTTVTQSYF